MYFFGLRQVNSGVMKYVGFRAHKESSRDVRVGSRHFDGVRTLDIKPGSLSSDHVRIHGVMQGKP